MTDYLTQCNAIAAEKMVWRWAKYTHKSGSPVSLEREDVWRSIRFWSHDPDDYTRTEYDGDADGNPIPAMLGPQELWDRHRLYIDPERPPHKAWRIMCADDNNEWKCLTASEPTYAAALAEANRIAGGAA